MSKSLTSALVAMTLSLPQMLSAVENYQPLHASLVYSNSISETEVGIYSFNATEYGRETMWLDINLNANGGGVFANGYYFSTLYTENYGTVYVYHYIYNPYDFSEVPVFIEGDLGNVATDLAWDMESGKIYGCFSSVNGFSFGTIAFDALNAKVTRETIAPLETEWNGCAIAPDGTLYAITKEGDLFSVDKSTGKMTSLGNLGITSVYNTSAAIDPVSGRFYYATSNQSDASLYLVDPATATAQKLYDLADNEQLRGMYFPVALAPDDAPAAPSAVSLRFTDDALSGTVTFTAPSKTYAGAAATGPLDYKVTANDVEIATGATTCGTSTSAQISVPEAGMYEIAVSMSNAAGQGPKGKTSQWIGNDMPAHLDTVMLTRRGGMFNISWAAVTSGQHNGYFDKSKVTYTVTRHPDMKVIADGTTQTAVSDEIPTPDSLTPFCYSVSVNYPGYTPVPVISNKIYRGNVTPPFTDDFSDPDMFTAYSAIDGNGDRATWLRGFNNDLQIYGNPKSSLDDWLILPGMNLVAGQTYTLTFSLKSDYTLDASGDPDCFELGYSTDPAGPFSDLLIKKTQISIPEGVKTHSVAWEPSSTGTYYVALHACSPAGTGGMTVKLIDISEGLNIAAPQAPQLSVVPDPDCALSAEITITVPDKTMNGETLTSVREILLSRDGEVIKRFDTGLNPGDVLIYTDDTSTNGDHTYTAVATNEGGSGKAAETTVYVGLSRPCAPDAIHVKETANFGEVEISWTPSLKDVNGKNIPNGMVTYSLYDLTERRYILENTTLLTHTVKVLEPGASQDFVEYAVFASTPAGRNGMGTNSEMVPVGPAYAMPYVERFDGHDAGIMGNTVSSDFGASWRYGYAEASPDGDNSGLVFTANEGDTGEFFTGKINVSGTNPSLVFFYYDTPDATETLKVLINAGDGFNEVESIGMGKITNPAWLRSWTDLSQFKGKDIQVKFEYTIARTPLKIDNMQLVDLPESSLMVKSISAQGKIEAGNSLRVDLYIQNNGAATVDNASVSFFRNGQLIESGDLPEIYPNEIIVASINDDITAVSPDKVEYHAVVDCPGDTDDDDNISSTITVNVIKPDYPAVETLTASAVEEGVLLSWTAPDLSISAVKVFDDVESYKAFSIGLPGSEVADDNVGGWTMVNNTPGETSSPTGLHPNSFNEKSFMVFSASQAGLSVNQFPLYSGHNGSDQCFICMPVMWTQLDKWMISPRLSGNAQTISFYAAPVDKTNGWESMEVLYSTTDMATTSFTSALTATVKGDWSEYTVDLPAGTVYFAIRSKSYQELGLKIDDISYEGANPYSDAVIAGYNIYRDGLKLNESPVIGSQFIDNTCDEGGDHVYNVTVVYDLGESRESNDAVISMSGIAAVEDGSIRIGTEVHDLVVSGAEGCMTSVYTVDGTTIYRAIAPATLRLPLAPGIYIVTAGSTTAKIAIR